MDFIFNTLKLSAKENKLLETLLDIIAPEEENRRKIIQYVIEKLKASKESS
ncbi:MAG: hypothetical protein J7K82_00660 [Thermoproteales archaeon]|nr:hypothetical protein [Thermoproteales archaeon]